MVNPIRLRSLIGRLENGVRSLWYMLSTAGWMALYFVYGIETWYLKKRSARIGAECEALRARVRKLENDRGARL